MRNMWTSLHLPAEDVSIEPDDIEASTRIIDNLQIHMIKWFFDGKNVPYLQFFKMATDKRLFSHNSLGNELVLIKKLLLILTIVVHALENMNQL